MCEGTINQIIFKTRKISRWSRAQLIANRGKLQSCQSTNHCGERRPHLFSKIPAGNLPKNFLAEPATVGSMDGL
jgi:hypothetical protein